MMLQGLRGLGVNPGDVQVFGGVPMVYTGSGWTSAPGVSNAYRAPLPPEPGDTEVFMSLAPGMITASPNQTLASYLANVVQQAGTLCMNNPNNPGCQQNQADFAAQATQFCAVNPMSPGCNNPAAFSASFAGELADYRNRLAAFNAGDMSQGTPVYPGGAPQNIDYAHASPGVDWSTQPGGFPSTNPLSSGAPTPQIISQAPTQNVLNPPPSASAAPGVTPGSISATRTQMASGDMTNGAGGGGTTSGAGGAGNGDGGGPSDISQWLKENWILLAVGAGALMLLPNLMKGGR